MSGKTKKSVLKLNPKPDKCPRCKRKNVKLVFDSDPYSSEICDDHTPIWQCEQCRAERAEEI